LLLCALYVKKIEKKDLKKDSSNINRGLDEESKISSAENLIGLSEKSYNERVNTPKNFLEESISMLERTSMKLYPVVKEVVKRMINETTK